MNDISEKAARSNFLAIRGVLHKMKEICPTECSVYLSHDEEGIQLSWRGHIKNKPWGYKLIVSYTKSEYLYYELEKAKDEINHFLRSEDKP